MQQLRRATEAGLALLLLALPTALPAAAATPQTLVGAGDIATCGRADRATARLLDSIPGTVFTTGDNAYPDGTLANFRDCYDPGWGRHLRRTRPSPGNHDYHVAGAAGYFRYFGTKAGPNERGYYAYNRGAWRIYSLNSEVLSNAQLNWLTADLRRNRSRCSMAYWHAPRFSSGVHGNAPEVGVLWRPLYRAGVELVVNGHDHDYERFAPQRPNGTRYWMGIREFVVGTGGTGLRAFESDQRHSMARQARVHGVLKLTLRSGSYAWRFVSVDGSWTDAGSARCHGRP
jgi:hypothetical protein